MEPDWYQRMQRESYEQELSRRPFYIFRACDNVPVELPPMLVCSECGMTGRRFFVDKPDECLNCGSQAEQVEYDG